MFTFAARDDTAVSFPLRSQHHIVLVRGPRSDFTRSRPPLFPPRPLPYDAVAPSLRRRDQSSAASHVPSQPHNSRLPIYTRLLMATLINFTGRQSNKALLWRRGGAGGAADVWFNLQSFLFFSWYPDAP